MAVTQLADIYEPLTFNAAVDEAAIELNRFLQSGVVVTNPVISQMASTGGTMGDMPFHQPLNVSGEPDYTTDDPADTSTPDKITTDRMVWRLASMHKSWSTMDLARELALMDPLSAITGKIGKWWSTQVERRIIYTARGVLEESAGNHNSDMLINIFEDSATPTSDAFITADTIIDAAQTMGDHKENLAVIAMHSVVYTNLQKQNLIDFIPNARGEVNLPTYLGYVVVVDDSMPALVGTNAIRYMTMLFAAGAFDNGQGNIMVPSEISRNPEAGNGGGQDIIHTRRTEIIHPYGYRWLDSSVAGQSPVLDELADSLNWSRVVDRKNVGIAFIYSNG